MAEIILINWFPDTCPISTYNLKYKWNILEKLCSFVILGVGIFFTKSEEIWDEKNKQ